MTDPENALPWYAYGPMLDPSGHIFGASSTRMHATREEAEAEFGAIGGDPEGMVVVHREPGLTTYWGVGTPDR